MITLECADTDTDGVVILGGAATAGPEVIEGDLLALVIREGRPDRSRYLANVDIAGSCSEFLASIPDDQLTGARAFADVDDGYDIETAAPCSNGSTTTNAVHNVIHRFRI